MFLYGSGVKVKLSSFEKRESKYTTSESEKLTRLPMLYGFSRSQICKATNSIHGLLDIILS